MLNGTLDLRRATDTAIVEAMKKHELPALSAKAEAKGADDVDGWDYLLRLRMDRVKASAVDDAEKAVIIAREAVAKLEATTAAQLWLSDLDEFETALLKMEEVRVAACSTGKRLNLKGGKGKKV